MSNLEREPVVNGSFYPAGKDALAKFIASAFSEVNPVEKERDEIFGLISPHAGYIYSGMCASYGYKLLKNRKYDTVVVMGPSHQVYLDGASIWRKGWYKTPLGKVEIDEESAKFLLSKNNGIEFYPMAHLQEHSIEVQIPFCQYVLKNGFQLVPIVIGNQTMEYAKILSDSLTELIEEYRNKSFLLIASSDLSHYHNDEVAKRLDNNVVNSIKRMDVEYLNQQIESGNGEACGIGPIMTLLLSAKRLNADNIDILNVTNSGEVSGDRSRVVGYMSAVVYRNYK